MSTPLPSKYRAPSPLLSFLLLCNLAPTSTASFLSDIWRDPARLLPFVSRFQVRADWKETSKRHVIIIDVPGIRKEDLRIALEENRVLRVSGERKREEKEENRERWHQAQRSYGKFWTQFGVPENADLATLRAKVKDGVLKVTISKWAPGESELPRSVKIAGGGSTEYKVNREDL